MAIQNIEPFAYGYANCKSDSVSMKIASGMYEICRSIPLTLNPKHGFAGVSFAKSGNVGSRALYYLFGRGIVGKGGRFERQISLHPELAEELKELQMKTKDAITENIINSLITPEEDGYIRTRSLWGGGWGGHSNPDYGLLLKLGTNGLREKIAVCRKDHPEASEWYDASVLVLDGIDLLADRYRELALSLMETAPDNKEVYSRIANALAIVPKNPACDFMTACQSFYLVFSFDGIDSPGAFDQYMIDYYRMTEKEEARRILEDLWNMFQRTRAWNLCISGSDENWNDLTNELSYEILDVAAKYKFNTPNITMRCHRNTPKELLKKAAEVIATGIGMPALYNDEVVCPALEALGIPTCDSHLYAMNGCNQFDIQGKSHMGLEDGEVCLLKCLEYALFDGKCLLCDDYIGLRTGDASTFTTFDQVMDAYKKQVEKATEITIGLANRSQKVYSEHAPNPLRSCLIQGCLEKGKDYKSGGPIYNHGQILTEGLADTADSLAAIKHFVFDTKEYDMATLLAALKADFVGYEEMQAKLRSYNQKFGNDEAECDNIAVEIHEHFFKELMKYRTFRDSENGIYGGGLSTFMRAPGYGINCGASANGRKARDGNIADSIGPTPGMDKNGPTAVLKSTLNFDQKLAKSGFVLQLKFDKKVFASPAGQEAFLSLVDTYFSNGGQQLSINVLSAEDLIEAQKHPENFPNLVVRVGGYSDLFRNLGTELQNNIIARTLH